MANEAMKSPADDLKEKTDALARANREVEQLKAEIALLNAVGDVIKGYDPKPAQTQLEQCQKEIAQKTDIAATAIKGKTNDVDKVIADVKTSLSALENAATAAQSASVAAANAAAMADADTKTKQDDYDALKKRPTDLKATLDDLAKLLAQAKQAETAGDYNAMYFYVQDAKEAAADIKIQPLDDYINEVRAKQDALEQAKKNSASMRQAAVERAKNATDAAQKYDKAKTSRQGTVLDRLKQLDKLKT